MWMTMYPPSLPTATYSVSCQVLCIVSKVVQRPGKCPAVPCSLSKEMPASVSVTTMRRVMSAGSTEVVSIAASRRPESSSQQPQHCRTTCHLPQQPQCREPLTLSCFLMASMHASAIVSNLKDEKPLKYSRLLLATVSICCR